nr:4Fe-4S dicluster domain-containing protein [Bacteroidales bacterium]
LLDTRDEKSRQAFSNTHPGLLAGLAALSRKTRDNSALADRIRHKYRMKNTTGYSLNALVDFEDPYDIIEHLMIGSEGTLGFISEITFRTVPEFPCKASSLMIFSDIENACKAVECLAKMPVRAVELIDRAGLRSVETEKGIPEYIKGLHEKAAALLVETAADDSGQLEDNILKILRSISHLQSENQISFTSVAAEYELLWKIRKGLFPSVGAMRKSGTTVIIEDVAFPLPSLARATLDLQGILAQYGYDEAVIFGHALEGNLHFVFTQDFSTSGEVERYKGLMDSVANLVVDKYDGSLKAEHGTGRNMAPYVELEWGKEAYELMKEIKKLFDPGNILNPGVILNTDSLVHLRDLKPVYPGDEITDKCIECGFCESACVSADLTLSPRQRIAVHRELMELRRTGREPHIAAALTKAWQYYGDETCATDGLCAMSCPVKIDTGKLVKKLREEETGGKTALADWIAGNMGLVTAAARTSLTAIDAIRSLTGKTAMGMAAGALRYITAGKIPAWNEHMPRGASNLWRKGSQAAGASKIVKDSEDKSTAGNDPAVRGKEFSSTAGNRIHERPKVVYFPSCINRSMGVSHQQADKRQLTLVLESLIIKAGYEVIYPDKVDSLCCGMAFSSKGYAAAGKRKSDELEKALLEASNMGEYPVVCDMSPCLFTMRENIKSGLRLYEPVEFILDCLLGGLEIVQSDTPITIFPVCSLKKMGLDGRFEELARLCSSEVTVADTNCCGFAGDRGFTFPELNRHGLRELRSQIPEGTRHGYSTSRTCETGLSLHSGITYSSIVYLVDGVSSPARK